MSIINQDSNFSPSNAATLAKELVQEMIVRAERKEAARKRAAERQQEKLRGEKQSQ